MITQNTDGTVGFRVYLPHAEKVEVVGDFTGWRESPVSMTREHPGWWNVVARVPAGEHLFSYLVDGALYLADYAAHGVKQNPYGGWVSRVVVAGETPTELKLAA